MMTTRQIVLLLMPAVFTAQSKYEPTDAQVTEISSMMDSSVSLPCNMTSNIPGDAVRLVLWFRQDKQTPVYSLDSRGEDNHREDLPETFILIWISRDDKFAEWSKWESTLHCYLQLHLPLTLTIIIFIFCGLGCQ